MGVELEFAGPDALGAAVTVHGLFGGTVETVDAHACVVRGTEFGDFEVALDSRLAHPSEAERAGATRLDRARRDVKEAAGHVVGLWLPMEIGTPPLPIAALPAVDRLVERLRRQGAEGTGRHLHSAFGLHLNPEVASREIDWVLTVFRAYLVLEDWLRARAARDPTRTLTRFIDPFPRPYALLVLDPAYAPDWPRFTDDYLTANPTRNRDLDLTPLLAELDAERVRAKLADPRVKGRPTFHYRLPDCRVDEPGWSVVREWNRWVEVEALAADAPRLAAMSEVYREHFTGGAEADWARRTEEWLLAPTADRASA